MNGNKTISVRNVTGNVTIIFQRITIVIGFATFAIGLMMTTESLNLCGALIKDMTPIEELVLFFEETPFGETAREGTIDEAVECLCYDRMFFKLAGLDYALPDFDLIESAITRYRNKIEYGKN